MNTEKHWWESKAIWANVIGIAISLGAAFSLLDTSSPIWGVVTKDLPEFLALVGTTVAAGVALWGRIVAKSRIGEPSKPEAVPPVKAVTPAPVQTEAVG